VKKDSS